MPHNLYDLSYSSSVGSSRGYNGFRNKLRAGTLLKIIAPGWEEKILEIGCNQGEFTAILSEYSADVYGIDINDERIRRLNNPRLISICATRLKFKDASFDKICAFETLEHIKEIEAVFKEAARVLKKGGKLFISFPFEIFRGQTALIDALAVHKNLFYARKLHIHRLTPKKIGQFIDILPLQVLTVKVKFIPYPSFVMILEKR